MLLYRGVSMGYRCIMRRFSGTDVNYQHPGILAPRSARRSVLPVDTGPVPSLTKWPNDITAFHHPHITPAYVKSHKAIKIGRGWITTIP